LLTSSWADGETLVVTGASGSVGGFAVELAAARGFTVIGVVRGLVAIRDGGKYVTVTALRPAERGIDVFRSCGRMDAGALRTLADMAGSGRLHTPVSHAYGIDDARLAYQAFAHRTGRGRLVLTFRPA
jgi:NADPH:quinone reductase